MKKKRIVEYSPPELDKQYWIKIYPKTSKKSNRTQETCFRCIRKQECKEHGYTND